MRNAFGSSRTQFRSCSISIRKRNLFYTKRCTNACSFGEVHSVAQPKRKQQTTLETTLPSIACFKHDAFATIVAQPYSTCLSKLHFYISFWRSCRQVSASVKALGPFPNEKQLIRVGWWIEKKTVAVFVVIVRRHVLGRSLRNDTRTRNSNCATDRQGNLHFLSSLTLRTRFSNCNRSRVFDRFFRSCRVSCVASGNTRNHLVSKGLPLNACHLWQTTNWRCARWKKGCWLQTIRKSIRINRNRQLPSMDCVARLFFVLTALNGSSLSYTHFDKFLRFISFKCKFCKLTLKRAFAQQKQQHNTRSTTITKHNTLRLSSSINFNVIMIVCSTNQHVGCLWIIIKTTNVGFVHQSEFS